MKKIDVSQTIHILANIGVLGGILLLAYELRQNNELMAAEARFNRVVIAVGRYDTRVLNSQFSDVWQRVNAGEPVSPSERSQAESYAMTVLLIRQWSYKELPESEIPVERWRRNYSLYEPFRFVYEREKNDLDPDFVQYYEENVVGNE